MVIKWCTSIFEVHERVPIKNIFGRNTQHMHANAAYGCLSDSPKHASYMEKQKKQNLIIK